ncbi:MAG: hypothetical protein C0467_02335 [Planctomycetaceae bacterium]|nr:hypothetical protein [Planctomycetaceae bacterium]
MPLMPSNDEVVSHNADGAAPIPASAAESPRPDPTPEMVLKWVAASGEEPWFPSRHATEAGTDRTALDSPLGELRRANHIRVATWVRGLGQGYVLTPEGTAALTGRAGSAPSERTAAPALTETSEVSPNAPEQTAARQFGLNLRTPVFVPIMLVANVSWFCVGAFAAAQGDGSINRYLAEGQPASLLHRIGAVTGGDLLNGEWWRLLSACFVHIGLLHLLANMFALAMMGPLAELLWGRWRLATIYIISGLAGSCLAMSSQPDAILAGASGAIWGILTSLLAWLMLFRSELPVEVAGEWARRLWLAFLLNAGVSFLPGVSWEAHLGGGVAGFVASGLLNALRVGPQPRRLLALVFLLALPVLCVGGLLLAMKQSQVWAHTRERHAAVEAHNARRAAAAADRERFAGLAAAEEAFNRDVVPRLNRLSPDTVRPIQVRTWAILFVPKESRNATAATELRTTWLELKSTAQETITHLAVPAVGWEPLDGIRQRARAFAESRLKECELFLEMLDSPTIPTDAAWTNLGNARRAVDAAWEHIRQK